MPQSLRAGAANSSDFLPVSIFFQDRRISELFAELLAGRGVSIRIIASPAELAGDTKIVTEPQFFPLVPPAPRGDCLLVGDPDAIADFDAIPLARPLTEEKIESALHAFLRS